MSASKVTVRSRLEYITRCRGMLNSNRADLFKTTVFGPWLDIPPFSADPHLLNYFYQNEVNVGESDDCPSLRFKIGDNVVDFGREEFCLITGFVFGPVAKEETIIGVNARGLKNSPFYDRIFPQFQNLRTKKVKGNDLLALMKPGPEWDALLDVDAVRVCLLIIATIVFMGREPRFNIPDHMLIMIEDLALWNSYPWGEYFWLHLYKRTVNVVKKHNDSISTKAVKKSPKKDDTYNLYGFVYALKIWILETFPNSMQWWSKDPTKTPRGVSWSKIKTFEKKHYPILFDPGFKPISKMVPRSDEVLLRWYIVSMDYIRGLQLQLTVAATDGGDASEGAGVEDGGDVHVGDVGVEEGAGVEDDGGEGAAFGADGVLVVVDAGEGGTVGDDIVDDVDVGVDGGQGAEVGDKNAAEGPRVRGEGAGVGGKGGESKGLVGDKNVYDEAELLMNMSSTAKIEAELNSIKSTVGGIEERVGADTPASNLLSELEAVKKRIGVLEDVLGVRKQQKNICPDLHADTPVKASSVDHDDDKLYYTDSQGFQGPMTQLIKAVLHTPSDPCAEFMQLDDNSRFDCSSLPNLNSAFSEYVDDGIDLAPHGDFIDMDVDNKESDDVAGSGIQQPAVEGNETIDEPAVDGGNGGDNGVEVICIDVEVPTKDDQLVVHGKYISPADINVVRENVRSIFTGMKRKRKPGKFNSSPYTVPPESTPRVLRKRSSRITQGKISPPKLPDFDNTLQFPHLEPFVENLSRASKAKKHCVAVPQCIQKFVKSKDETKFIFPWGNEDTVADRRFWMCLLGIGTERGGWLRDEHLDVWVDLLWTFRPADADWAMAGAFFSPSVMENRIRSFWSNGVKYPLPWSDVEKVLFPINEPNKHWATAELHIRTGVVTIYDSLPRYSKKEKWWNKTMPEGFSKNLPTYLKDEGVLQAKGIEEDGYKISWKYAEDVPTQCSGYGDCGIWVCINLYRLGKGLSLKVDDPEVAPLAYRERIAEYLWKYKVQC